MRTRLANRNLAIKLLLFSAGMFAFGVFAMPTLYDKFCEITGIGQAGIRISDSGAVIPGGNTQNNQRTVKVLFDATANSSLPWEFKPLQRSMIVTLGEASESSYMVKSLANRNTSGQAVYNVTPPVAAQYFVKTECFCFSRQELAAGEYREMPVRFYIEAGLPEDIVEMTLSYTFFLNEEPGRADALAQQTGSGNKEP